MKKLSFKGDPPPSLKSSKKKKSKRIREDVDEINNLPDDGWVVVKEIDDLSGPVIILFARGDKKFAALSSSAPSTISTAIKNTPFLSPIHADTNAENPLATVEPDSVRQVWIITKLPGKSVISKSKEEMPRIYVESSATVVQGETSEIPIYSLRTPEDTYLTTDKYGSVTTDAIALGPQQEWTPIFRPDGIAWQSVAYGNYLQSVLAEDKSSKSGQSSLGSLRADSTDIGFREVWRIKCQAAEYKKRRKNLIDPKKKKELIVDEALLEFEQTVKYQTWGGGRRKITEEDQTILKKASESGKLNEVLLDRRIKLKADRYCK